MVAITGGTIIDGNGGAPASDGVVRNGALASKGSAEFGTIEAGKRADLLPLDANPLAVIANLRTFAVVMPDGRVIDRGALAAARVLSR